MEKINRRIKKLNYYLILGFSIFQLVFIIITSILCIINNHYQIFFHLTNWSFLLSSIYIISISICDTSLYFFSSKKLEKYYYFIKNSFSNIAFPYCFMITIGFWGILLVGLILQTQTFLKSGQEIGVRRILMNLYLHLGITVMMVVELFLNERDEAKLNWCSGIANTLIFIAYSLLVCISKYGYDHNAYVFMEKLSLGGMILVGTIIFGLLVGCFFSYIALSNRINRKSYKVKESGEDSNLIGNENMNEENCALGPDEF